MKQNMQTTTWLALICCILARSYLFLVFLFSGCSVAKTLDFEKMIEVGEDLHTLLAEGKLCSRYILVASCSHLIYDDHPELVVITIHQIIETAREGNRSSI